MGKIDCENVKWKKLAQNHLLWRTAALEMLNFGVLETVCPLITGNGDNKIMIPMMVLNSRNMFNFILFYPFIYYLKT